MKQQPEGFEPCTFIIKLNKLTTCLCALFTCSRFHLWRFVKLRSIKLWCILCSFKNAFKIITTGIKALKFDSVWPSLLLIQYQFLYNRKNTIVKTSYYAVRVFQWAEEHSVLIKNSISINIPLSMPISEWRMLLMSVRLMSSVCFWMRNI